ncbi:Fe-S cluster assembly ATPase SufC [Sulfurimonas sp.]|nr:Fe-S cluster assembly ATPase SufC [Sulfurimonas sp.]
MLKLNDLTVSIDNKEIIKSLNLEVKTGEVHVVMGLNGTGKSTLLKSIASSYECTTSGLTELDGENVSALNTVQRAHKGIFMSFQNPIEIPGVNTIYFIKTALNELREAKGLEPLKAPEFMKLLKEKMAILGMDSDILNRSINVGFSGGEKKRSEVLQMLMLEPKLILLDEIDSGLDIDALKTVTKGINSLKSSERSMIIVTHYSRLLEYIKPDVVHILAEGKIVKSGDISLAIALEEKGYEDVLHS